MPPLSTTPIQTPRQRRDRTFTRADGTHIAAINENKVAELADYHLSPMEFITVKSRDRVELNASIIKPPDFNPQKKYPVLVYTYGGPHAQVVRNAGVARIFCGTNSWRKRATLFFRWIIAVRRAAAMRLKHRCISAWARKNFRTSVTVAQYLKSLSYVDANRIGIWGWSYGGHMTLHAMFEAGDDFKAGFRRRPGNGLALLRHDLYRALPRPAAEKRERGIRILHR